MLADLVRQAGDGQPQITLSVDGDESGTSTAVLIVLYRAAQEALTNGRRHSGARQISVSVTFGDRDAQLVVADDGEGVQCAVATGPR
jgi:signal transduction histidine kinase